MLPTTSVPAIVKGLIIIVRKCIPLNHGAGTRTILFSRLTLIAPELIQVLKWETSIGEPVPLLDDLSIEKRAVF